MRLALRLLLSVIVVSLAIPPSHAEIVWIETEQFDKPGGWTNDAQFIDQMGSPYLMAIGLGTPVEDASTTVRVPSPFEIVCSSVPSGRSTIRSEPTKGAA